MGIFGKLFGSKEENKLQEDFDAIKISDKETTPLDTQPIADLMGKAINDLEKISTKTESQNKRILKHLKSGKTLTGIEALRLFDCFCLAQRIGNLRGYGFEIKTTMITTPTKKRVAEYSIES